MSFTSQEITLLKKAKAQGKTKEQALALLVQSRPTQGVKPTEQSGVIKRVISDIPSDLKEGFLGVGEDLTKRGEKVMDAGQARMQGQQGFTRTAFQQLGQIAGGAGDILSRGVTTAGKLFTTPEAEENISTGMGIVAEKTGLLDAYKKLEEYKEANPEKARDIEAGLGILELALDRFGIKYAKKRCGSSERRC
jgi:hypothetical protein